MLTQTQTESNAQHTALSTPETEEQEQKTPPRSPRATHREQGNANSTRSSGNSTRRTGARRARRQVVTDAAPALMPWPQPIPIVEVGMRIRAHDGQSGTVMDAMDCDGILTYLVQLDGRSLTQLIPARTLKGAQI